MAKAAAKKSTKKAAAKQKTAVKKAAVKKTAKAAVKKTAVKKTAAKATEKPAKKVAAKATAKPTKKVAAKATAAKATAAKATAATQPDAADAGGLVHCYRLIFQVDPGGSRKAESFVAGTLAEAKEAALADLGSGIGAYHALFYGEEIVLQCWEGSKKLATIDLHPYITYKIEGREPLQFKDGEDIALDMDEEDEQELMDALNDEAVDFEVTIAWEKIGLPALLGRPLRAGESIALEGGTEWKHDFHEHWDAKIRW